MSLHHIIGMMPKPAAGGGANALLTDLAAYWPLDEASGDALDVHSSLILHDRNTVGAGTGKVNGDRVFTASSLESLDTATDSPIISAGDIDFTFAGWVNLASKGATRTVFAHWTQSGSQRAYALDYNNGTDRFRFYVSGDGAAATTVTDSVLGSPSTGTWYFIVCWHDAANDLIGIQINNGTPTTAAHSTGVKDSSSPFYVGRRGVDNNYMDGSIDELGMWKRLLTSDEKTFLYNSGNGREYSEFS